MHLFQDILFFQTLESTNDFIKQNHQSLNNHTVVQTNYQTKGRGQFDRVWESLPNVNLLFSILFKESIDPIVINDILLKSISITLEKYHIKTWFKEPNDIYVYQEKIAGILIETKYDNDNRIYLVVGIGLNVNQQYFTIDNATSLSLISGGTYDVNEILLNILSEFENLYMK